MSEVFPSRRTSPVRSSISFVVISLLLLQQFILAVPAQRPIDTKPATLISSSIVISQVYGGGGNTGAPFTHDFVELFNRGTSPVSINGWSIQYASATGTGNFGSSTTQITELPNVIIQPGQYYLVQEAGGTTGTALPTPDLVDATPINMSGTAGKVALANVSTSLGCNGGSTPCSAAQLANIVDLVGFGTANFFEGTVAPAPSNTTSIVRGSGGCTETDNNGSDFSVANPPTPRNTATTLNVCVPASNPTGVGSANPSSVSAGGTSLLTVSVTPGSSPTSTGLAVTGDLSSIGGSATQAFFDNGTNGDTTSGDNVFSYSATVDPATTTGAKSLAVTITDAQARTGNTSISLTVTDPAPTGASLPLFQDWTNTGLITVNNDWSGVTGIVGYRGDDLTTNTGTDPQTLLQDGAATPVNVTANQTSPDTFTSGGFGEFHITDPVVAFQGSGTADAPHLVISVNTTGATNVTVKYNLRDIDGSADDSIQSVALQYRIGNSGSYTNIPGAFVADASSGPSEATRVTPVAVMLPSNAWDHPLVQLRIMTTNAVGNDELIGIDDIAIENNGTLPLSASGSASPSTVNTGSSTLLTVTVNPGVNPASTGIAVVGNLSTIGGSATQAFFDNGTNGDTTAGDNVFSYLAAIPSDLAGGSRSLAITVTDAQARTANTSIGVTIFASNPQVHLTMGNPTGAVTDPGQPTNYLMVKTGYSLSYHRDRGIPNWVAWHLDSSWIGTAPRQDDFRPDTDLPAGWYQVQGTDYSGSGFDRGHHTPSGDRTVSVPINSETFLMTNMMPQAPDNNQGPWEALESDSRSLANAGNELYIYMGGTGTGGVGSNGAATTIAGGNVVVPAYTWKVILVLPGGANDVDRVDENTRAIAVIMPNRQGIRTDNWRQYLATVDQVEALTGYDFFTNVPVSVQNVIESRLDPASNTSPATIAGGTVTDLRIDSPNTALTGDVTVNGVLTLGGSTLRTGANRIILGPGASVERISGLVEGSFEKQFSSTGVFEYPVGTSPYYTPLTVNVTALGVSPSSLTVSVTGTAHPDAPYPATALKRYWTLTETGDLTADLTFQYLDADIPATVASESSLVIQRHAGTFTPMTTVINAAANTGTTTGISTFSDWTMFGSLAPSSAPVTVSGRVLAANGLQVSGAVVLLLDTEGNVFRSRTSGFGYFTFDSIPSGRSYVISVTQKQHTFEAQVLNVNDDVFGLEILANP